MWTVNFESLHKKHGLIRGKVLGGGFNYVSRNTVILGNTLKTDEVMVSMPMFLELWKYRIIYKISQAFNVNLMVAEDIHDKAATGNPDVIKIMEEIIRDEEPELVILRNPTNNYSSIIKMKIKGLDTYDPDTYVLRIPDTILGGLTADFDGDVLTIIGLVIPEMKKIFRMAATVEHMVTHKDSGLIRRETNVNSSCSVALYNLSVM
jgi:DNA-directed RNA polymerase beta' subunit